MAAVPRAPAAPRDGEAYLRREKLVPGSVGMVPESVPGIGTLNRGYVAECADGKAFLVRETSPESAAEVMNKLRSRIGGTAPAKIGDEGFEATDKYLGRLCFFRKGSSIGGFTGLAAGADAVALAARLAEGVK